MRVLSTEHRYCDTISTMRELAAQLLKTIRKQDLLRAGDRVAVAVSGGADSVALLCLLDELQSELGIVLSVAHVNHKLRGAESDDDERFVAELAAARGLAFHAACAPVNAVRAGAARAKSGVEAAARRLRYEFFGKLGCEERITKIATAHTLDDQAETVLLRMFRGTGIRGLAGILPRMKVSAAEVVRPLLGFRRADLRDYLQSQDQSWREDSSNEDVAFLRNRVRKRLLPLIAEEFGKAAIEHIAELAEIARAEEEWVSTQYLVSSTQYPVSGTQHRELQNHKRRSTRTSHTGRTLDAERLLALPLAMQRRQIRAWLEANAATESISFRLIEEIRELAAGAAGKKLGLPGDSQVRSIRRSRTALELESVSAVEGYRYTLPVPGAVTVPELSAQIEARIVEVATVSEEERAALLDPGQTGEALTIRNWRAGDRFWPAHTSAERKVKDLLSERHATGANKKVWPVAADGKGRILWMRGFATPEALQARGTKAIYIREAPSSS